MSAPIQHAMPEFLARRHGFQRELIARVRQISANSTASSKRRKTCSRLEIEAGWYATVRVPATRSDEDTAIELLEKHGVAIHPATSTISEKTATLW